MLENRIQLCEKAALLAQGGSALSDSVLQQAVTLLTRANFELPIQVRLVLCERHAASLWQEMQELTSKARTKEDALKKVSQSDRLQTLQVLLLPVKANVQEADDVLRSTYANVISAWMDKHEQAMQACELTDEPALMEQHAEVWEAGWIVVYLYCMQARETISHSQ